MCNGEKGKQPKITLEIEIRPEEPDHNGVRYAEKALREMAETAKGKPIVFKDQPIGIVDSASYDGRFLKINGFMFGGGTSEQVVLSDKTKDTLVTSAKVVSVGFSLP